MCGIVGYIGNRNAQSILVEGLKKLEYRGYDSAGISVLNEGQLHIQKVQGRLANLEGQLEQFALPGHCGIGHTRWATHGKPSDYNSHPHSDESQKICVVHNGIIENYLELKQELLAQGVVFRSDTDTEVIAHLVSSFYEGDLVKAVQQTIQHLRGAFALGVLTEHEPDKFVAVRFASPLLIGVGKGENFIASDIPAILEHTRDMYILDDGELAVLTKEDVQIMKFDGTPVLREVFHVDWDISTAEKAGYDHFMLKEIYEQPRAYIDTMSPRMQSQSPKISLDFTCIKTEELRAIRNIHIVACGTAYHAGLVGKVAIEQLAGIPVEVDVASEYRYRSPLITNETLVIVVSQSGETADTLAALREAKRCGARVLAITNVVGSSVAREADDVLTTWAGPEIAVASTKAYTAQLIAFYLLGLYFAEQLEKLSASEIDSYMEAMRKLPEQAESILAQVEIFKQWATHLSEYNDLFFIGRGVDHAAVVEGSLKLKEISYIHSDAYAAGELKHGTLALVEEGTPIIAVGTQPALIDKLVSNVQEIKARGGHVIGIGIEGANDVFIEAVDEAFIMPATLPLLTPALSAIPLQLVSYYVALCRGNDVDKPRNLAKSVTVE